jgi:hypothetical protein
MNSARRPRYFFAQLANKDVDDLGLGFVQPAVEMVEEHFLRQGGALA